MGYELAKLLEQAGWPQAGSGVWVVDPDSLIGRHRVYVPRLEELIEACGNRFEELRQVPEPNGGWIARSSSPERVGRGNSPVEAVARLWLALRSATAPGRTQPFP